MKKYRLTVGALGLCLAGAMSTGAAMVLEYSFPASFNGTGVTVTDLGGAGNDLTLDGAASLTDDRPAGFDASLMSLSGSVGGHGVTSAIDLLDNTLVAANNGFTMDAWVKWDGVYGTGGNVRKIIDYAGTESLRVTQSQIQFNLSNGGTIIGMDIVADQWYHVVGEFLTENSVDGGGNLAGIASLYVDGNLIGSEAATKTAFGDSLNRPIAINRWAGGSADHYQGATFNPKVELIPEPATLGMVALFGGGLLFIRRKLSM